MKINRGEFLRTLESVQAGLTKVDELEQSACFIFQSGEVYTYNGSVASRMQSTLDDSFYGAVPAETLLEHLRKRTDEIIEIRMKEGIFTVRGRKSGKAKILCEAEVALKLDDIEQPQEWKPLHAQFGEAIRTVQYCCKKAQKNEDEIGKTCVHLEPGYVEGCDNYQVCRWDLETGLGSSALIPQKSIKHITALGVHEVGETEFWLHFRNPSGLMLSYRRLLADYPETEPAFAVTGKSIALPKILVDIAALAQDFSKKNVQGDRILVRIRTGELQLIGDGITGEYQSPIYPVQYKGPQVKFLVSPEILQDVVKRHNECVLTKDRLAVLNGPYRYVLCLFLPEEPALVGVGNEEVQGGV